MHICLTGATGFVGKHLARRLAGEGATLSILARRHDGVPDGPGVIACDLLDEESVQRSLPACDAILHLASRVDVGESVRDPASHFRENPAMLLHLLEAVRKRTERPLVVFTSTDRLYGMTDREEADEATPPEPIEPYTASKILCEFILKSYARLFGIPFIILRFSSVYGPGQTRRMFIGDVIHKMSECSSITVGSLDAKKNFVYVDDVVDAFLSTLLAPEPSRNAIYNIGGELTSLQAVLRELLQLMENTYGRTIEVRSDPNVAKRTRFEVRPFRLSTERARKHLGWKPKIPLREGLARSLTYVLSPPHA